MSWQAYVDTRYDVEVAQRLVQLLIQYEASWPRATSIRPPYSIPKVQASGLRPPASRYAPSLAYWSRNEGSIEFNTVAPAEIQAVVASFADKEDVKKVQSEGFHVASEKFITLKSDDRSLYGKKGKEGVVIVKTKQAILVAHYPESVQPGSAATTVEQLGDYLIKVGY
ncbi:MAG: hypothetical protein Q9204_002654 [Flavoplaca sp. TL-2023a]